MNQNNKIDHTKTTVVTLLLALLAGLVIGIALGIQIYLVPATKLGFWQANVDATSLSILAIRHQIQGSTKLRTIVEMGNTGATAITCNCTLYYKDSSSEHIATYTFNITINAGQTTSQSFIITPIDVSEFVGTDLSVFEY